MNEDAAHKVARVIADVCARYPGCVLPVTRLRKIRAKGASKSRRTNRKQANHLRGKINQKAREKAFAKGVVTVEVNPHGTSQYCSRCGLKGERFSLRDGKRIKERVKKPASPCPATGRMGEACETGHPAKDWQVRPVASRHAMGTAIVGPTRTRFSRYHEHS